MALEKKYSYRLTDVFDWVNESEVQLPSLQRGFVWKPYKIENLWDSILRGYPFGLITLAPTADGKLNLIDGQQRVTSIALAADGKDKYFNAQSTRIFIDLARPRTGDDRKYVFRVITRSHPWGYDRTDNRSPLKSHEIFKARALLKIADGEKYYERDLSDFWPYDAIYPVPFSFFVEAAQMGSSGLAWLDERIAKWRSEKTFVQPTGKYDVYVVKEILEAVEKCLREVRLPASYLPLQLAQESSDVPLALPSDDDHVDDIENLFFRLNTGGEPISAEDLNYSGLKSKLSADTRNALETACLGLMRPARLVTVAYRLFQIDRKGGDESSLRMRIKPREFQRAMRKAGDVQAFETFLASQVLPALARAKTLLTFDNKSNPCGMAHIQVSDICQSAPEVLFLLLYRIAIVGDTFSDVDSKLRALGILTMFSWFGTGDNRTREPLLKNVWAARNGASDQFWSRTIVQRAYQKPGNKDAMIRVPKLTEVQSVASDKVLEKTATGKISDQEKNRDLLRFIAMAYRNKNLVLFAQRETLSNWFAPGDYLLDDTQRPFDWDHISPAALKRSKGKNVHEGLKGWYESNGNFRAWPYSRNRGDQHIPPSVKLAEDKERKESFCDESWRDEHAFTYLASLKDQKTVYELIMDRNYKLLAHWYDKLKLTDLIPEERNAEKLTAAFSGESVVPDGEDSEYYLSFPTRRKGVEFYVMFDPGESLCALRPDGIEYGIFSTNQEAIDFIKNISGDQLTYQEYSSADHAVFGRSTLLDLSHNSILALLCGIDRWLTECLEPRASVSAPETFLSALTSTFRKAVRTAREQTTAKASGLK